MRHEVYTVRLLDPHLRWLAQVSPELNAAFEYVLNYIATPHTVRKPGKYLVADIVVAIDQWSAASHNERSFAALLDVLDPVRFRPAADRPDAANDNEFIPTEQQSANG